MHQMTNNSNKISWPHQADRRPLSRPLRRSTLISSILASILLICNPTSRPFNFGYAGCLIQYYDENLQAMNYNKYPNLSKPGNLFPKYYESNSLNANNSTTWGLGLDCQNIMADQLHDYFNRLKPSSSSGPNMVSLVVRDSNLSTLSNLPQGTHQLKRLILSNTSIDLEVLKEGSESLKQLTTLEITNEKISNMPQNFFQEMKSLKELRLDNDGIASLDADAFHNLDDSLELLSLKDNRFNRFPMAVKNLAQLAVLDLSDNDIVIDMQESDLPEKLEPLLNLRELKLNRINCTCEFSSSPFYEWIVKTHIYGVRCFSPEKLKSQEVIVFERDEFCARSSGLSHTTYRLDQIIFLIGIQIVMWVMINTQL